MRRRVIGAWIGLIVLGASVSAAREPQAPPADGRRDADTRRAGLAKLRSRVAELRAEVEMLQIEHDVDATLLKALLTDVRNLADMESAGGDMARMVAELKAKHGDAGGELPFPVPESFKVQFKAQLENQAKDDEKQVKIAADIDKSIFKIALPLADRKKKEFAARTAALNEKKLELEEAEALYREAAAERDAGRVGRREAQRRARRAIR